MFYFLLLVNLSPFLSHGLNNVFVFLSVTVNKSVVWPAFGTLVFSLLIAAAHWSHGVLLALSQLRLTFHCGSLAVWLVVYDGWGTGFNWCESNLELWQGERRETSNLEVTLECLLLQIVHADWCPSGPSLPPANPTPIFFGHFTLASLSAAGWSRLVFS